VTGAAGHGTGPRRSARAGVRSAGIQPADRGGRSWPAGLAADREGRDWPADPPPGWRGEPYRRRRRRVPLKVKTAAALLLAGLIFRRAIASVVLMSLSAALHLVGIDVRLPSVKFGWPWQAIGASSVTEASLGPWVLQKVEGITRPAFGQANFSFLFTRKVSRSIGPWPCWYASTFYALGHASATVDLNPGRAWWAPATGHYQLRILSRPADGRPGQVAIAMVLPEPQLPPSAQDVTINDIPSRPIDVQHSWTYPGLGCGVLLRPQFPESVLYAEAQQIAFYRATHVAQVTRPLIQAAETAATQTIRNSFVQPTVNAFGYRLERFTLGWAAPPAGRYGPG
jgi:hypothetical protein